MSLFPFHASCWFPTCSKLVQKFRKAWYQLLKWRTFAPTGEGNSYQVIPEWLKTFLCEKGVSKEKVEQRIGKALKAISLQQLEEAKQSDNPWRKLKALTDRKGKTFRWVKEDELQSYIESKAAQFVGVPKCKAHLCLILWNWFCTKDALWTLRDEKCLSVPGEDQTFGDCLALPDYGLPAGCQSNFFGCSSYF